MRQDIYSMTKDGFHEALRQAKEQAWDEGSEAEYRSRGNAVMNPYRSAE